jgi:hypothetical protein
MALSAPKATDPLFRAAFVYDDYSVNGLSQAQVVADDLAKSVRSIMRNEGGPVAGHSIYPILGRTWTDPGYAVAIVPPDVTIRSIVGLFGFVPGGTPEAWPEDQFKVALVQVTAETFCLQCHTEAKVGETCSVPSSQTPRRSSRHRKRCSSILPKSGPTPETCKFRCPR